MATQEQQAGLEQEMNERPGDAEKFDVGAASQDDLYTKALEALNADFDAALPEGTIPTGISGDQPRNDKGQFVKKEEAKAEDTQKTDDQQQSTQTEESEDFVIEQPVENEGSGTRQIFRGRGKTELEAYQDLNRKLLEAQRNATKKIREQETRIRAVNPQQDDFKPKQYTDQDEFVISQEMMRNPSKAFATMFKDQTGYEISEFRSVASAAKAYKDAQTESIATENFLTTHPDYVKSPKNGERLVRWVKTQGDQSKSILENLEAAYDDLSSSGLLETKTDVGATDQPTTKAETQRIAETDKAGATQSKTVTTKAQSSSVSQRGRTAAAPVKEKTAAEVAKNMSQDELRELAYQNIDQFFN